MLQPARRKFRKEQKGRNTGIATRGNKGGRSATSA
jgi:large subunit ribosomal protein L16